jgi:hypothetical protein
MSRRPHEFLGSVVSARVALAESPPEERSSRIEETAQTVIVLHGGGFSARCVTLDDRVLVRLVSRNTVGSGSVLAMQVCEQLRNRQVGHALSTKRSAVVGRFTTGCCRLDPAWSAQAMSRLGRIGRTRVNQKWPRNEEAGHALASIDEIPPDGCTHRKCMSLAHRTMGFVRPGRISRTCVPDIEPHFERCASLAISVDRGNWRRATRPFTSSAHADKLVAPTARIGFIACTADRSLWGGRCGARTHDLHGVNVAL